MPSATTILLLGVVVLAAVEFAFILARSPRLAMAVALLAAMGSALQVDTSLSLGGVNLTAQDFVCVLLAVALAIRLLRHSGRRPDPALMLMLTVIFLNLVRGADQFGLSAAANEAREAVYFLVAAAFFSTVRVDLSFLLSVRRTWLVGTVVLAAIASAFWLQRGFGTFAASGERALTGSAALLILEATILALVLPLGRRGFRWLVPAAGLGLLLLSDQRTVWVAGLVSIATLCLFSPRVGFRRIRQTASAVVAAGLGVLILLLATGFGGVAQSLNAAYGSSFSSGGTFSWRATGWAQLIDRQRTQSVINILLGNPAGTGFLRVIQGGTVSVAPHSEYVTVLVTLGLVGLTVLVVAFGRVLRRLAHLARGQRPDLALAALAMLTLLVAQLVYFTTYSIGFSGGILFGVASGFSALVVETS